MALPDDKYQAMASVVNGKGESINGLEHKYWKAVAAGGAGGRGRVAGVASVNGKSGVVTLAATDVGAYDKSEVEGKVNEVKNVQTALSADVRQLQSTQLAGLTFADKEGNSYNDITKVIFNGATVDDVDGQPHINVDVKPKITVANGQAPDSKSASGNALIFEGSNIVVDPHDANVIKVFPPTTPTPSGPQFDPSMFASAVDHGYAADDQGIKSSVTTDGWWIFKDLPTVGSRPDDAVGDLLVFKNQIQEDNPALRYMFVMAIGKDKALHNKVWFMYRDGTNWTPWFSEQGADQATIDNLQSSVDELKRGNQNIVNVLNQLQTAAGQIYAPTKTAFDTAVNALIADALGKLQPGVSGLNIADAQLDVGSANKLEFMNGKIEEDGSGGVQYTPYVGFGNQHGGYTVYNARLVNALNPLKFEPAKSGADQITSDEVMLSIDHGAFEPMRAPSFLAYLEEDEEIVGKHNEAQPDRGHHDGKLWFGDVVKGPGMYIETDMATKRYGIQESDELDPAVTGGTNFLVAYRIHMKGKAPSDGMVRMYLYNASIDPFDPKGYLTDVDGQPMVVQRNYKAGEVLGSLDVVGVVNAKGIQEFTCHVMDTFANDSVMLTDRTEGCTGLMIQALTTNNKTGDGLLQYQLDTAETISFSSHYLGTYRMSLGSVIGAKLPFQAINAGYGMTAVNGLHFDNLSNMKAGVMDNHLMFQDNGTDICDFTFGKVFSAEETQMLRGKSVKFSGTIIDKDDAWNVSLMKWTGAPDAYTDRILASRNNGSPVFSSGWEEAGKLFVTEDAVAGDHVMLKDFTVPTDANNYAIIIYPVSSQMPITLKLKEFKVDVATPFTGYVLKYPKIAGEYHLAFSEQYKQFIQDTQGYASLRYTLNDKAEGLPMPVGEPRKGAADISLDPSVNKVSGSSAKGGEGAVKFDSDGQASIRTKLNVWNEQATKTAFKFWWSTVDKDGKLTKIPESELSGEVGGHTGGTIYYMPTLKIQVEAGDRIALSASADKADGAYLQCNSDNKPMVDVEIQFNELTKGA